MWAHVGRSLKRLLVGALSRWAASPKSPSIISIKRIRDSGVYSSSPWNTLIGNHPSWQTLNRSVNPSNFFISALDKSQPSSSKFFSILACVTLLGMTDHSLRVDTSSQYDCREKDSLSKYRPPPPRPGRRGGGMEPRLELLIEQKGIELYSFNHARRKLTRRESESEK